MTKEEAELAFIGKHALPVKKFYNLDYKNAYRLKALLKLALKILLNLKG